MAGLPLFDIPEMTRSRGVTLLKFEDGARLERDPLGSENRGAGPPSGTAAAHPHGGRVVDMDHRFCASLRIIAYRIGADFAA
jgi:hypothetical protein